MSHLEEWRLRGVGRSAGDSRKMIPSLRNKSYEERLARLNLLSRKTSASRKTCSDLKYLKRFTNVAANKLFSIDDLSRTRSNEIKLICRQTELDCTKFFFTNDIVWEWNKLPPSVVQCITVNSLKIN